MNTNRLAGWYKWRFAQWEEETGICKKTHLSLSAPTQRPHPLSSKREENYPSLPSSGETGLRESVGAPSRLGQTVGHTHTHTPSH